MGRMRLGIGVLGRTRAGWRGARGVTLLELLVVVGIAVSFTALLVGGFKNFQSGFRGSSTLSKVDSALHYARNLAIANNCVYHVRFENVITEATMGTVGKPLGDPSVLDLSATSPQPLPAQSIAIYCFPDMATAMSVTSETLTPPNVMWNPMNFRIDPKPSAWSATAPYRVGDSVTFNSKLYACTLVVNSNLNDPSDVVGGVGVSPDTVIPPTDTTRKQHWRIVNTPYENYLVDRTVLLPETYVGIQYDLTPAPQANVLPVLYFNPDGTATCSINGTNSSGVTLFVTDSVVFADDHSGVDLAALNVNRKSFYNTRKMPTGMSPTKKLPWMKVIQVFQGGMIKIRPVTTPTGAPNPLP